MAPYTGEAPQGRRLTVSAMTRCADRGLAPPRFVAPNRPFRAALGRADPQPFADAAPGPADHSETSNQCVSRSACATSPSVCAA